MAEQEFDIEWVGEHGASRAAGIPLPQNFITIGSIENDDVKVYIRQDVYKSIEKLSKSDTTKELGSILIGNYRVEMGKTHVVISDYIEAKHTDATASTLTFTHDTWDDIHAQMNGQYRDKKIIGWQHTHPNYGIFLSNYDLFIQENFFNLPFQVAYVVDPIADTRGFFQWKHGQIHKLNGFNVYDENGKKISVGNPKAARTTGVQGSIVHRGGYSVFLLLSLIVMFVSLVCLGYYAYRTNDQYQTLQAEQRAVAGEIAMHERASAEQRQAIADQQKALEDLKIELEKSNTKLSVLQQSMNNIPKIVETKSVAALAADRDSLTIRFVSYTVRAGDTISQICKDHGIPYHEFIRIIRSTNGLDDADSIFAGQVLLLPVD